MSLLRKVGVVVLVLMLTTSFVATNAVAAAHLTVLDPDFVTTSLDEEGGYELVEEMFAEGASGGAESTAGDGAVDAGSLMQDALTEEYIRSETDRNVQNTYAYLHGNTDELEVTLSTAPIRENLSDGFERQIRNASLGELLAQSGADLPGPIDAETLDRMTESEESYERAKADVRADLREEALDRAAERAFEESSNDELVRAAGENPDDYSEAEKERFVREYEPEIKAALRDRIEEERGDEIDAEIDARLEGMKDEVTAGEPETEMERAAVDVQVAVLDGLKSDATYDEFQSDVESAKADLAAAATDEMADELEEEFPEEIDLTGNASDGAPEPFQQARTGVVWFDRLTFVLPVGILALVGLLYHLRDSVAGVASDTGISMLLAGLPTVVAVEVGSSQLESMAADAPAEEQQFVELVVGIVGRGLSTVGDLALVLTAGGVVLIGVSLVLRFDLLDGVLGSDDDGRGGTDAAETTDDGAGVSADEDAGDEGGTDDEPPADEGGAADEEGVGVIDGEAVE